jgi:hypothetical protein
VEGAPDPTVLHPVSGQERVVFLKPLATDPSIEVGESVELVTEHARTIMSGTPAELERIALAHRRS